MGVMRYNGSVSQQFNFETGHDGEFALLTYTTCVSLICLCVCVCFCYLCLNILLYHLMVK